MDDFTRKQVFVTGATSGIGRGVALAFGSARARVGVLGRRAEAAVRVAAEVTAAGGQGVALVGDVGDGAAVEAAFRLFLREGQPLNILVNAAGVDLNHPIAEAPPGEVEQLFRTNTFGPLYTMQQAIPRMRAQRHGVIINVTSISSQKVIAGNGVYGATKAATSMLSKTAAAEEGPFGIRINEIQPGPVDTPMLRGFLKRSQDQGTGWSFDQLESDLPLRRVGQPQDIADAVLWLCSDQARFITGACLAVDGGFLVT